MNRKNKFVVLMVISLGSSFVYTSQSANHNDSIFSKAWNVLCKWVTLDGYQHSQVKNFEREQYHIATKHDGKYFVFESAVSHLDKESDQYYQNLQKALMTNVDKWDTLEPFESDFDEKIKIIPVKSVKKFLEDGNTMQAEEKNQRLTLFKKVMSQAPISDVKTVLDEADKILQVPDIFNKLDDKAIGYKADNYKRAWWYGRGAVVSSLALATSLYLRTNDHQSEVCADLSTTTLGLSATTVGLWGTAFIYAIKARQDAKQAICNATRRPASDLENDASRTLNNTRNQFNRLQNYRCTCKKNLSHIKDQQNNQLNLK